MARGPRLKSVGFDRLFARQKEALLIWPSPFVPFLPCDVPSGVLMQRELRLGDILDDYCPRERRLTNHAIVAMVGQDVKQTRCTTCDADHEYKQGKVPRQRRKAEASAALYSQVLAGAPKRVTHEPAPDVPAPSAAAIAGDDLEDVAPSGSIADDPLLVDEPLAATAPESPDAENVDDDAGDEAERDDSVEEGPVHRPLIRATLPRQEGQAPPARPAPDFTIRQPAGRPGRFRPRQQREPQMFGNRSNGNSSGGPMRGGMPRQNSGRPPQGGLSSRRGRRQDNGGRKRSK
jgi:hypothetical protein